MKAFYPIKSSLPTITKKSSTLSFIVRSKIGVFSSNGLSILFQPSPLQNVTMEKL